MSTVGFGDVKPISSQERIFMAIFAIFACGVFGYIIS